MKDRDKLIEYLGASEDEIVDKAQSLITDKEFNKHLDDAHDAARDWLKTHKEFRPVAVVVDENGHREAYQIDDLGQTSEEKRDNMRTLGKFAAEQFKDAVVAVYLTSEAWMSQLPKDHTKEDLEVGNYTRPSQDPNRKEVLMTTGMTIDTIRSGFVQDDMVRKGNKLKLEPSMYAPYVKSKSDDQFESNLLIEFFKGYANERVLGSPALAQQMVKEMQKEFKTKLTPAQIRKIEDAIRDHFTDHDDKHNHDDVDEHGKF